MGWISAGAYEVALDDDGKVICRNAKGRQLKTVPAKLADDPAVIGLRQLTEWLERHQRECVATVERWMIRSLPVPTTALVELWPDEAWRTALRDLVITDSAGAVAGYLRDADPVRGLGLVDLDGDSVRIIPEDIRVPHPVLLEDLGELRDFATELDLRQGVGQLHREVFRRTAEDPRGHSVDTYAGGVYQRFRFLAGRAVSHGYRVRGGQAVCPVFEGGRTVEARVWLGDAGYDEAETGPLGWTTADGTTLTLGEVGPVAWSEGMRMAADLYAGRDIKSSEERA